MEGGEAVRLATNGAGRECGWLLQGFLSGICSCYGSSVTEPDEAGHVQVFKYKDGLMLDEFIGTFVDAVRKNPNSVNGDGMDFLLLMFATHQLASFESKPGVYVKKK